MKSKITLTLIALIIFSSLTFGQRMVTKTNVLFGPFFKSIRTIQEVKVGPRISTQTIIKVRPSYAFSIGHMGSVYVFGNRCNGIIYPRMGGGGNISEFRIYSKKKGAMHGFYYGPYSSISFVSLTSAEIPVGFSDPKTGIAYSATLHETYKLYLAGGGFQIGVQSMKKRFCVDWTILAIGFGKVGIKGTIDATNTSDNFDFRNIMADNSDNIRFGIEKEIHVGKVISANEISFDKHMPCPMIRMGLSFGFGYMMAPKIGKSKKGDNGSMPDQKTNQPTDQKTDQTTDQKIDQQTDQGTTDQSEKQAEKMKKKAEKEAKKKKDSDPKSDKDADPK